MGEPRDMPEAEAREFFAAFFFGEHHIPGKLKPAGWGWSVTYLGELASFDFDGLTRLVFLAHDRCVRVSVSSAGPRRVCIMIHPRAREGGMSQRHPTLEHAIALFRKDPVEPNPNITLDSETRLRIATLERDLAAARSAAGAACAKCGATTVPVCMSDACTMSKACEQYAAELAGEEKGNA